MSILRRRDRRSWTPEPFVSPFPGWSPFGADSGGQMSTDRAMQVSTVWACIRLLADTVSMMPLGAYTTRRGIRVPAATTPALIKKPSADLWINEWLYAAMVSLLLRGNLYGIVTARDYLGTPVQIELLDPDHVGVGEVDGRTTYWHRGAPLDPGAVFHMRAYVLPGVLCGLSPIRYAARQLGTDLAVSEFAYAYFRDGAHPSAILSTDEPLDQEEARTAKERFTGAVRGREPAVLSGGLKYSAIQVSPEESQFLATQKLGATTVARIFGVPPEMVGADAGNSMTYSNREQRSLDFLTYSVQPWLGRFETVFSGMFPGSSHVRFDPSVLLRTDLLTTMQASAIGIASKQTTPDEARALRDLPPLTQAQKDLLDLVPLTVNPANGSPKPLNKSDAGTNVNFPPDDEE